MPENNLYLNSIFLDDIRNPEDVVVYTLDTAAKDLYLLDRWRIIRNYNSFVEVIMQGPLPRCISFDHDLGVDMNKALLPTGYDCAKWLINYVQENLRQLPHILCHSQNPVGRENILSLFDAYKRHSG